MSITQIFVLYGKHLSMSFINTHSIAVPCAWDVEWYLVYLFFIHFLNVAGSKRGNEYLFLKHSSVAAHENKQTYNNLRLTHRILIS